jgi:hypothetical protein
MTEIFGGGIGKLCGRNQTSGIIWSRRRSQYRTRSAA